jgi:hypothetical protein
VLKVHHTRGYVEAGIKKGHKHGHIIHLFLATIKLRALALNFELQFPEGCFSLWRWWVQHNHHGWRECEHRGMLTKSQISPTAAPCGSQVSIWLWLCCGVDIVQNLASSYEQDKVPPSPHILLLEAGYVVSSSPEELG